jgi:hypothetical protein
MAQADALGLDEVDHDLKLAARLVHAEASVANDLGALREVIEHASLLGELRPEEDAADLSARVFQGEIRVP